MSKYFASPNEHRRLQNEWANLREYGIVFEYMSVLTALAMRIPGLSQIQILDKFIRGLKPKTGIEIELRDPKTPDEAYRLTDHFDRIVYGTRNTSFLTQNYNRYAPTSNATMNADYREPMQIDTLRPRRPGPKIFSDLTIKVFSDLAIKDSALHAKDQNISQQIAPLRQGNSGRKTKREKDDFEGRSGRSSRS